MVKTEIAKILERALDRCAKDGLLPAERAPVQLDAPKNPAHGDFACNAAMVLQKQHARATGAAKPNPRALAQAIVDRIEDPDGALEKVEIAGPGFLNLIVAKRLFFRELGAVWREKERFGHTDTARGRKTMVEFVSANPTGPMHVGHGRGAVIGDTVARLLEWSGHDVLREFYVNDAGGQVWRLAHAVYARATEIDGSVPVEPLHPDDYQGEYVKNVAQAWLAQKPDLRKPFEELKEPLRKFATGWILENFIKEDLKLFGIRFDRFFSEKTLHDEDRLRAAVAFLEGKGLVAEELLPPPKGVDIDEEEYVPVPLKVVKTTRYGDERDRPLFKTNGEPTYFAADIAYHFDKIDRGYQRLVDVWGADHGGYVPRMKAAVKAMGGELEIILFQLVNLMKDGQPYRMSKRAANFVTLRELLETAGADATRVFFLLRRGDMALDFDIGLAQKRDMDNPVFYVQYGHARCRAILRKAKEDRGLEPAYDSDALSALELPEEVDLVKRILAFPELVASAAQSLEPHRVVFYLQETIAAFHGYYTKYKKTERVISDDPRKTSARLYLVWALAQTLHNALEGILGVTAPDRMDEPPGESESG
ncbi:MAG: arginine--tRNA ligase [Deltaproteobacteria bacterium]|nr:MAG: arginine--tRNA ligase [Deltaproteobacteria bacterium]